MKRPVKILECIRQGQIGGGESHLLSLVENLDKEKFEPVVLSFTPGPMVERLKDMGVKTKVIFTERPFDIFKWKEVREFIASEKVQLVHSHGTRASSNIFWGARSLGLPIIYTVHGWSFHDDQNTIVKNIRILGEKLLTSKTDVNISVSQSNRESGLKHIKDFNSVVINNGIDQKRFDPDAQFKDIRAELNIDKNALLVLFIARFTAHKQPIALIKAFARAVKEVPELQLLMVGEGDQKTEALSLVQELKLEDKVIFTPFRQDVPHVLAAADIFVLPSLWEGLPIGLLEAMSMGKTVIGTNVDGTKEVIAHNSNGLMIGLENLESDLAKAIVQLAKDGSLRKRLSEGAVATVRNKFNAALMTREIEDIYLRLISDKKTA